MIAVDIDALFQGRAAPRWLRRFAAGPDEALDDLLIGRADLGTLGPAEPSSLLLDWLYGLGERFRRPLDEALARWIERAWGEPILPGAGETARVTAVAWQEVALVIAEDAGLSAAPEVLRAHVLKDRAFLDAMTEGPSRDPLGRAWIALARHQRDRALEGEWWRLCSLPPDEPWYRGECGIHGLRGLAEPRAQRGIPTELPFGIVRLAVALRERVADGWLAEDVARDELARVGGDAIAAYPVKGNEWAKRLGEALGPSAHDDLRAWIAQLLPRGLPSQPAEGARAPQEGAWDPTWPRRARDLGLRLKRGDPTAPADAEKHLDEQRAYARRTHDWAGVVKCWITFAGALRERAPESALRFAEQARDADPWNAHAWTTIAACLRDLHRIDEAFIAAEEAVRRFPDNPFARTALAEVLRARGALDEAEAIYRDIIERTANAPARRALATLLANRGRFEEGEALLRAVLREGNPDDRDRAIATTTLETIQRARAAGAAATHFGDATPHAPAVAPLPSRPSPELREGDVRTLVTHVHLLRSWGMKRGDAPDLDRLRRDARQYLEPLLDHHAQAAGELGLSLVTVGDLQQAAALLRLAAERFPGHGRVRYALARAERELARTEHTRLDEQGAVRRVIEPWKRLDRLSPRFRPAALVGEGRAWLALTDGAVIEHHAREAFGRLGYWIGERLAREERHERSSSVDAWAARARDLLFGGDDVRDADGLPDMDTLRQRLDAQPQRLDRLEEELVYQIS